MPASTGLLPSASSAPSLVSSTHARRKLSSAFDSMETSSDSILVTAQPKGASIEQTDHHREGPLQSSSDSVFLEHTLQERLLGNNWEQPASPQVLIKGRGRPNPLTSYTSSRDTPPRFPITRKSSLPTHTVPRPQEWGVGLLSPLAKSRTPSGKTEALCECVHNEPFPMCIIASSTLSISPKHLREISDPILNMLTQLHKLVFVTQVAPPLSPCSRWTLLQHYKRALFGPGSSALALKTHLHKLATASTDTVGDGMGEGLVGGVRMLQCALKEMGETQSDMETILTYDTLQQIIETLAAQHGYQQQQTTPPAQKTTPTRHTHQSSA